MTDFCPFAAGERPLKTIIQTIDHLALPLVETGVIVPTPKLRLVQHPLQLLFRDFYGRLDALQKPSHPFCDIQTATGDTLQ